MAAGDVYKFVGSCTMAGNIYQVSFAIQRLIATDVTPAEMAAFAESVKVLFRPQQHTSLNYTGWTLSQLWGDNMVIDAPACTRSNGRVYAGVFAAPTAGAISAYEALPPQCAAVTTLTSGIAGRRKRGRNYMTGLVEDYQNAGNLNGTFIATQTAAWTVFLGKYKDTGTDPTWKLGVWSERVASGCVPKVPPPGHVNVDTPNPDQAFTPVTDFIFRTTVKNQRRRSLGVGR